MQKDDEIRLTHMLSAAREAQAFIRDETRASIEGDRKTILALVKAVEIIGEAASKVSGECQKNYPQIPCRKSQSETCNAKHRGLQSPKARLC